MSLRFLRDGWYFQTIDATGVTCEWCGASFDATGTEILKAACIAHRRECPPHPRLLTEIRVDPMVPSGYLEVRDENGVVRRQWIGGDV